MDSKGRDKNVCFHVIPANNNESRSCQICDGISLVVAFLVIHLLLVVAPAWSYFQYDFVSLTLHLEEPRVLADEAVVQSNRAIGLTAWMWVIPVNICALVGLCCFTARRQQRHRIGVPSLCPFTASYLLLGAAIYWPIQFWSSRLTYSSADIDHVALQASDGATLILVLVFAMSSTCYLTHYQKSLINDSIQFHRHIAPSGDEEEPHQGSVLLKSKQDDADEQTPLWQT
jgi:hypothetical protein